MSTQLSPQALAPRRRQTAADRRGRIEWLRARAHYERMLLRRTACEALQDISPGNLALGVSAGLRSVGIRWLSGVLHTARRYPILLSLASSAVSGLRHGNPYSRLGVAALLVWRLWRRRRG
ncbi:MAG TPA: hypothetical protein VL024_02275 [Castellaniella sp.]|nr:hypothetical protein [Castellaniella sp.]